MEKCIISGSTYLIKNKGWRKSMDGKVCADGK